MRKRQNKLKLRYKILIGIGIVIVLSYILLDYGAYSYCCALGARYRNIPDFIEFFFNSGVFLWL